MSALNVCLKPDRCIIMQDAAMYHADGEIIDFVDKGEIVEGKNLFVANTGWSTAARTFARFLDERFDDIDQIGDGGELAIASFYRMAVERNLFRPGLCLIVAGWSARHERARCALFTDGIAGNGYGFAGDIGSTMHPVLKGDALEHWKSSHGMADINIVRFDPMIDGLHLLELQRRQPGFVGTSIEGQYVVGGHVKMTEVRRNRIDQRVIRTWTEDQPGRRIIPGPMPVDAGRVHSLSHSAAARDGRNRADRRRAERMARKGVAA